MSEATDCIIMRKSGDRLFTHGPAAAPMTATAAQAAIRELQTRFPHQQFVMLQEIAHSETVHQVRVKNVPPRLSVAK